ncbi:MAG: L,D-transpeptidase [Acidobacteriia bacterium]|nr:L,D-transpeptidase [Terriglobia bacterium]
MRRTTTQTSGQRIKAKATKLVFAAILLFFASSSAFAGDLQAAKGRAEITPTPPERRIVVSIPDRELALIEDGRVLKVYPVAVGTRGTPSPAGQFKIVNRVVSPAYYHEGRVIPPGKSNPLGNRWMGLDKKGYGIHGTDVPSSIGKAASHGCIRMAKRDVEELFEIVRVGDVVEIHGKRTPQLATVFGERVTQVASATPAVRRAASRPSPVVLAAMAGQL